MSTHHYYTQHAQDFFQSTKDVDMAALHGPFLDGLPAGARILDAGCGSGRDAKAFAALGHRVTAFDASPELAALACEHSGLPVAVRRFDEVVEEGAYDAIWCCASLLHVPLAEMPQTLARLWRALRPGGRLYMSFKHGSGERDHGGRRFTDATEEDVKAWTAAWPQLERTQLWLTNDQRPGRHEQWTNALLHRSPPPPRRLVTGGQDPFLPHLQAALDGATHVDMAVAFVKSTGLRLIWPHLQDLLARMRQGLAGRLRLLTSDYLDVTDPAALRELLLLQEEGAEVRVHVTQDESFHLKAYLFARHEDGQLVEGTAFIGSSNLSHMALTQGLEWNYRVVHPQDEGFVEICQRFDELFQHPCSQPLSDDWISQYEQRRRAVLPAVAPGSQETPPAPQPSPVQLEALAALADSRHQGYQRGLVVLATGLGKTWLSAFDAQAAGARRVLFVAHREEILSQAASTFVRLMPHRRVGLYRNTGHDLSVDVLCASVQTLHRAPHLGRFQPQHFDYIVVDEFHHAAAATYRRVLAHFQPRFMLGLTATPQRSDQSDVLSLCDDHLAYECNLFDGIQLQLLAPFHYHGIRDETVNYQEIPWRNGQFDPTTLHTRLATLARARHALRVWQDKAQQRTLAFCVSKGHADFMAQQFCAQGVKAAAVYSGSSLGRTQALQQLSDGRLQVLFSVDLFNEGVDLPSIDTVMMLRPTESQILFLQQLGRGLRLHEGKQHLVVLDFIGNHHSFLARPQALFGVKSNHADLARLGQQLQDGTLELPPGCFANYDLQLIDLLKALRHDGPQQDFQQLSATLGRRPSLAEFYRGGASVQKVRQQHGHWFAFVQHMQALEEDETAALEAHHALLRELEAGQMTRSFKALLLEAWLELDGLAQPVPLPLLAQRSHEVLHRRPHLAATELAAQVAHAPSDSAEWQAYWRKNPVAALTDGNTQPTPGHFFHLHDGAFTLSQPVPAEHRAALAAMVQEIVDYRLAQYEARQAHVFTQPQAAAASHGQVSTLPSAPVQLPFFPSLKIACGHFRQAHSHPHELRPLPARFGALDASRHFIALADGHSMEGGDAPIHHGDHLLFEVCGSDHIKPEDEPIVALERSSAPGQHEYLLRVLKPGPDGQPVLHALNPAYPDMPLRNDTKPVAVLQAQLDPWDMRVGQAFMREDIPPLFGTTFNPGSWNVGHVTLPQQNAHVLLVTLNKQGKAQAHRYHDHWIDAHTFHWQTQNSTTPSSKRGQEIIHHQAKGISLHLFVREHSKAAGGKAMPFVYKGRATVMKWEGAGPMGVWLGV